MLASAKPGMARRTMQKKKSTVCLFCWGDGPFNTVEHIVPESLGNDSDILEGLVCDKCQNYLGREIEKPALEKTPFAFWRSLLGVKTKKGKLPSVQLAPPNKGRIPATHPLTDEIGFTAHQDGTTSVDIDVPSLVHQIATGKKQSLRLVLSPWHLNIMGRFLGKIGLEYLALFDASLALDSRFDVLRAFVRRGSTNYLWPIFMGQQGHIKELKGPLVDRGEFFEQEVECYRYSLGVTDGVEYIFAFSVGVDLMLICLSHRRPEEKFLSFIQGVTLECVYYPDGSW
jgi:hypothetical protein